MIEAESARAAWVPDPGRADAAEIKLENPPYDIEAVFRRMAEGNPEMLVVLRYAEIAAEFVRLKVDVIFAGGTEAAFAAKQATSVIPIVFPAAGDPVGSRLVASHRDRAATSRACPIARLPTMFSQREHVAYGPNYPDLNRRAADHVDEVLRGARPDTLPVEQPTKFDLVINLITAKALGVTVPETLLARPTR